MKLSTADILVKIRPALAVANRYKVFIFVLAFLGIYVYLVDHIGRLIQADPTNATAESEIKPISRLKIDKQAAEQMNQLEAQNIEIKALFDNARQNPFTEN